MNGSLPALVEALRRALREEVAPDVAGDHARTQLAAVVDILGKLEAMIVWSPEAQRYMFYGFWHRLGRFILGKQKEFLVGLKRVTQS